MAIVDALPVLRGGTPFLIHRNLRLNRNVVTGNVRIVLSSCLCDGSLVTQTKGKLTLVA